MKPVFSYIFIVLLLILGVGMPCFLLMHYHSGVRLSFASVFFDWDEYGDLLAGVFTLAAATFSCATLIYLTIQHREAKKEQFLFFNDQRKQWKKEDELTELEKWQKHRQLFFNELATLEHDCRDVKFLDSDALYQLVFPKNSVASTATTALISEGEPFYAVVMMWKELVKFVEKVDEIFSHRHTRMDYAVEGTEHFIHTTIELEKALRLGFKGKTKHGRLLDAVNWGLTIFNPREYLLKIDKIVNALLVFSGNETIRMPKKNRESIALIGVLLSAIPEDTQHNKALGLTLWNQAYDLKVLKACFAILPEIEELLRGTEAAGKVRSRIERTLFHLRGEQHGKLPRNAVLEIIDHWKQIVENEIASTNSVETRSKLTAVRVRLTNFEAEQHVR